MHWSEIWPSLVGTSLGGVLALVGTLFAWWLARRAELGDRPRRELVPLASRLLAAIEAAYGAEQAANFAVFSLGNAERQASPNAWAIKEYSAAWTEARETHRRGLTEARTTAAEVSLLYPQLGQLTRDLIESIHIAAQVLRSDEEVHVYETARTKLMGEIAIIANRRPKVRA
jgi:hypothetical protein